MPITEKALHTYLLSDDSKLSHLLGAGNSEMNKTQYLLSRNSQSSGKRQKSKAINTLISNRCLQYYGGSTAELENTKGDHVTQMRSIKKGFLEEVTFA